jgi:hypothetical protein
MPVRVLKQYSLQLRATQIGAIATAEPEVPGVCSLRKVTAFNMDVVAQSQASQIPEGVAPSALKLSMTQKQDTLCQLRDEGWLAEDENDCLLIGVRSIQVQYLYVVGCQLAPVCTLRYKFASEEISCM